MANKAEKIAQARLARGEISDSEYSRIMLDVSAPVTKVRVKKVKILCSAVSRTDSAMRSAAILTPQ